MLHLLFTFIFAALLTFESPTATAQPPRVYLSEVMHSPVSPEPEWIELWNDEDSDLASDSLSITDLTKVTRLTGGIVHSRSFLLITKDSSALRITRPGNYSILQAPLPSFNNSGDVVILRYREVSLDSLRYTSSMGGSGGKSLERRSYSLPASDTSNWSSSNSALGATPGAPNQPRVVATFLRGAIVISEIMAAPISPEPEWIELQNMTDSSIDLQGWKLVNGKTSHIINSPNALLRGAGRIILCSNDTTLARVRSLDTSQVIRMTIGTLPNSGGTLMLESLQATVIDSASYPASKILGRSLERFDLGPSGDSSNWMTSRAADGATPLALNSWTRRQRDVAVTRVSTSNDSLVVLIRNVGLSPVHVFTVHFTLRSTIDSSTIAFLASGDSTSLGFPILQLVYGLADATAWTSLSDDEEPSNDTLHAFVLNPIPKDSLSITEIMFRPEVGSCEWIELYNHSNQPIALDSCYLLRESATTSSTSRFPHVEIGPQGLALIAADSRIFTTFPSLQSRPEVLVLGKSLSLTDDSATVSLLDSRDTVVASATYHQSWYATPVGSSLELQSLERTFDSSGVMNRENGTPLRLPGTDTSKSSGGSNSLQVKITPNPFCVACTTSPACVIEVGAPEGIPISANLFDAGGNLVRVIAQEVAPKEALSFDGKDDQGRLLSPGLYVLQVIAGGEMRKAGLALAPPR